MRLSRRPTGARVSPRRRQDERAALLFLAPALVIFGLFAWFPMVRAVLMSFQRVTLVDAPTWVGLDNFRAFLADPTLGQALANTVQFLVISLLVGFPLPLLVAVLISETRRYQGFYSAVAYLPVTLPPVVAILLWKVFLRPDGTGLFNRALGWIGLDPVRWLTNQATALPTIVVYATWAGFGATAIIYLAAIKAVPAELYDAADIDGASVWHKVRYVLVPQLRPLLVTLFILQVIAVVQVFIEPWVFTGGGPNNATTTILVLVYKYAFYNSYGQELGTATALSLTLAICLALLSFAYVRVTRRWDA